MLVELGNPKAKNVKHSDPCVTYINVPDTLTFNPETDLAALRSHISDASTYNGNITNSPGDEALLTIVSPSGAWAQHSSGAPSWVACDRPEFATALAAWYGCPVGKPADVEETHWTVSGPPGTYRSEGPVALVVNSGNDVISQDLGGGLVGVNNSTATSTSSTSLTNTGAAYTVNAYAKCLVVALSSGVYGIIESNTATVLTIDRWYNPATPGGAAATTPSGTTGYIILSGAPPAWFIGLSSSNSAPSATDTTLGSEIVTSGGGLIRALATYTHTASASTFTLSNTWTANGTDSLPVTIYRSANFISAVVGWSGSMVTEDTLNASATIAASGDQLTLTFTATV